MKLIVDCLAPSLSSFRSLLFSHLLTRNDSLSATILRIGLQGSKEHENYEGMMKFMGISVDSSFLQRERQKLLKSSSLLYQCKCSRHDCQGDCSDKEELSEANSPNLKYLAQGGQKSIRITEADGSPASVLSRAVDDLDLGITDKFLEPEEIEELSAESELLEAMNAQTRPIAIFIPSLKADFELSSLIENGISADAISSCLLSKSLVRPSILNCSKGSGQFMARDFMESFKPFKLQELKVGNLTRDPICLTIDNIALHSNMYIKYLMDNRSELSEEWNSLLSKCLGNTQCENFDIPRALEVLREQITSPMDLQTKFSYLSQEPKLSQSTIRKLKDSKFGVLLSAFLERYFEVMQFPVSRKSFDRFTNVYDFKKTTFLHSLRVALTAAESGPPICDLLNFLGKDEIRRRLLNFNSEMKAIDQIKVRTS